VVWHGVVWRGAWHVFSSRLPVACGLTSPSCFAPPLVPAQAKRTKENLEALRREAEERNRTALDSNSSTIGGGNASTLGGGNLAPLLHPLPSASPAPSPSVTPAPASSRPSEAPFVTRLKVGDELTLAMGGVYVGFSIRIHPLLPQSESHITWLLRACVAGGLLLFSVCRCMRMMWF